MCELRWRSFIVHFVTTPNIWCRNPGKQGVQKQWYSVLITQVSKEYFHPSTLWKEKDIPPQC
jgi:hypothetical protein